MVEQRDWRRDRLGERRGDGRCSGLGDDYGDERRQERYGIDHRHGGAGGVGEYLAVHSDAASWEQGATERHDDRLGGQRADGSRRYVVE